MASRLELLQRQHAKLTAERFAHHARMAELAAAEDQAREEAIVQAPTQRSDAAGAASAVGRLRRKRKEIESALSNIEAEISALEAVRDREAAKAADEELAALIKQAIPYKTAQLEGWRKCGELFKELYETWRTEVVMNAEALDDWDSECRSRGVLGGKSSELQTAYAGAAEFPISPFPITFRDFLQKLSDVAFDEYGEGYRIVAGEEALSAKRADYGRLLPSLIPDLRGVAYHARLSGRIEKFTTRQQAAEGSQPVPSDARQENLRQAAAAVLEL